MGEGSGRSQLNVKTKEQTGVTIILGLAGKDMCLCVLYFSTSCFLLRGSFVYSHSTFQPILQLNYSWLIITSGNLECLHLPILQTGVTIDFILFTHQFSCPFLFVFVWLIFFPLQVLRNIPWKHHMNRWWLRSYSRSGHVWISNSYLAGLSWKICPECSIFQWVSWLIAWMPSAHHIQCPCPLHLAGWGNRRHSFGGTHHFSGLQGKPAS